MRVSLENFSENSIYSFQNEINAGFITIRGGHRIGISGTSVFENNQIKNIKYISSLNIRVAREIKFCGEELIEKICLDDFENTLIISPPGCGKTTLLRDAIRILSNGSENLKGNLVVGKDLRGSCALLLAALLINDTSYLDGYYYIKRGYENFINRINLLGANINEEETFIN